mgnify:CR=1 FL=1
MLDERAERQRGEEAERANEDRSADQHEDTCPYDRPNPQCDQVGQGQGAIEAVIRILGIREDLGERTEFLDHAYKELEIPPAADGGFIMEPHALHIWPRGHYMCIALPNDERTFTVTLFMPHAGAYPSFAGVQSADDAQALFERDFVEAERAAYMETCVEDDEIALRMDAGRRALMERGTSEVGPYQSPMEDGMQHFHEFLRAKLELDL